MNVFKQLILLPVLLVSGIIHSAAVPAAGDADMSFILTSKDFAHQGEFQKHLPATATIFHPH